MTSLAIRLVAAVSKDSKVLKELSRDLATFLGIFSKIFLARVRDEAAPEQESVAKIWNTRWRFLWKKWFGEKKSQLNLHVENAANTVVEAVRSPVPRKAFVLNVAGMGKSDFLRDFLRCGELVPNVMEKANRLPNPAVVAGERGARKRSEN